MANCQIISLQNFGYKKIWYKQIQGQTYNKDGEYGANMTTQAGPVKSRWD